MNISQKIDKNTRPPQTTAVSQHIGTMEHVTVELGMSHLSTDSIPHGNPRGVSTVN